MKHLLPLILLCLSFSAFSSEACSSSMEEGKIPPFSLFKQKGYQILDTASGKSFLLEGDIAQAYPLVKALTDLSDPGLAGSFHENKRKFSVHEIAGEEVKLLEQSPTTLLDLEQRPSEEIALLLEKKN